MKEVHSFLSVLFMCVIIYVGREFLSDYVHDETEEVNEWLEENQFGDYKNLFSEYGISTLSSLASPDQVASLPELPEADERRLRRATVLLQQRLVLRQWLIMHQLQYAYSRLLKLDVSSLEDVYWLEDSRAQAVLGTSFTHWSAARQTLPTDREKLQALKDDLWSAVVKRSRHQDAWTWGGMVVVSVSVAGLLTLAALTQPALAPEARHSLLQYVTGKYLHAPSCTVDWGWEDPHPVGDTMSFTVYCYQRNGHPYPISDADDLSVSISHANNVSRGIVSLGVGAAHAAQVQFTVRAAGNYELHVTLGGAAAAGGPFRRTFTARGPAAHVSRVARVAAVVYTAGHVRPVVVHARDVHGNVARLDSSARGFQIRLNRLGCPVDKQLSSSATFNHDTVNQQVMMTITFNEPGIYRAVVTYEGEVLMNGEYDCIVLTPGDAARVSRHVSAGAAQFCARLVDEPARLLAHVTRRHVTLRWFVLKVIPAKRMQFRLCSGTTLSARGTDQLTLDDGVRPAVLIQARRRDVLAATLATHLDTALGGDGCFQNKQQYLFSRLRSAHARHAHDKLPLRVSRDSLLQSSVKATRHFTLQHWCRNFDISFVGEQGVDWGGVSREWFSLLCGQLFDSKFGLFVSFNDKPGGLVHPNPNRPPHLKLKHFELAGKIVGKCLYESALGTHRLMVRARFCRAFLAQVAGRRVHYKHFEQDDPELYLSKVKYILETDMDAADSAEIYFADDEYGSDGRLVRTQDLVPNGRNIRVVESNKLSYLSALAGWRLARRPRRELAAFLRGLALLVPPHGLAHLDEGELELVLCGTPQVCVSDWRAHCVVSGGGPGRGRVLTWLWAALAAFSNEERARLLQFATGGPHLPPGGFRELNPRFQITWSPTIGALPTAHTCFNQLVLPDYDSYEQLVRALLWAINEGAEGFGMV